MTYSISYRMQTGEGRHSSVSAAAALHDHAGLLIAHANKIVVRDAQNRIVSLPDLLNQRKLDGRRAYENDGNSD